MSHDAAHAVAVLIGSSAALLVVSSPQGTLSDLQVLLISASCGAIGGIVATLMSDAVITVRGMLMRGLASVLIAPGIVSGLLLHYGSAPTLMMVASAAGVAGMVAWPVAQQAQRIVQIIIDRFAPKGPQS